MRPRTALLHIGTKKTGTTSIQECLARAQAGGALAPARYPLWRNQPNHRDLITLYRPRADLPLWLQTAYPASEASFQRRRRRYRRFLLSELGSAHDAIISAEALSGFSPTEAGRLREDLESMGYRQFHVIVYIRDPADYYLSATQERLKASPLVADPNSFEYGFREIAETWEQAFPGSLVVRAFPSAPQQDVIDDFAGLLKGLMDVSLPRLPLRMNMTVSAEGMQILQDYQQTFGPDKDGIQTPEAARLLSFLRHSARDIPQTRPVLKDEVAQRIRANHHADAELIFARYGVDLGLRDNAPTSGEPQSQALRVAQIVQSVDSAVVNQLLMRLARSELGRSPAKRPLPLRVAARAYRSIPPDRRPKRLNGRLRSLGRGESQSGH